MQRLLAAPWVRTIGALWCSDEQKAIDAAEILSRGLGLPFQTHAELGENDRSATGYLAKAEFEATADQFFAHPHEGIRGWERAVDAQARIVRAIAHVDRATPGDTPVCVVSHGGVGALLFCHLARVPISRQHDQPPGAGGYYFRWRGPAGELVHGWRSIDSPASP
jgi:broad specificity phosphatase PhoE